MNGYRISLRKLIVEYLENQKLMQLATVSQGKPWICSVWQVADENLNIYFFSSVTRRHSIEIEMDASVAGALALPHSTSDKPRGLQFEGRADKLGTEEEIIKARKLYENRIFDSNTIDKFINSKTSPHAFYKITPKKYVLFDVANFPEEPRQEYEV